MMMTRDDGPTLSRVCYYTDKRWNVFCCISPALDLIKICSGVLSCIAAGHPNPVAESSHIKQPSPAATNVNSTLNQRLRRWPSVESTCVCCRAPQAVLSGRLSSDGQHQAVQRVTSEVLCNTEEPLARFLKPCRGGAGYLSKD